MSNYEEASLALLRSIDSSLKQILAARQSSAPKAVASDRELDGKYGNPVIKFAPRDWTGEDCKGRRMSECPAPFLEMLAETFDYFARKSDETGELTDRGKKVADYKRMDAARARGWAKRIRDGKHTPAPAGRAAAPAVTDSEWDDGAEIRW